MLSVSEESNLMCCSTSVPLIIDWYFIMNNSSSGSLTYDFWLRFVVIRFIGSCAVCLKIMALERFPVSVMMFKGQSRSLASQIPARIIHILHRNTPSFRWCFCWRPVWDTGATSVWWQNVAAFVYVHSCHCAAYDACAFESFDVLYLPPLRRFCNARHSSVCFSVC